MLFVTIHCAMYVHILYAYFCGLTSPGSPRMIQSRNYVEILAVNCSFHTLTDIIRQFNPLLKGTSVTSQSRGNIPYSDDLNVAFVGASARSA